MAVSHRTNRLKLIGTPAVEQLQNGRYQLTVNCTTINRREDWYSSNKARIFPDFGSLESAEMSIDGLAPRTGEAYTDMRLVSVESSTQGDQYIVTLVYETLGASFVQIKDDTIDLELNGLRTVKRTSIAQAGTDIPDDDKDVGVDYIDHQIDSETAVRCFLSSYTVDDTDSYREFKRTYIQEGTLSVSTKNLSESVRQVTTVFLVTEGDTVGPVIARNTDNFQGLKTITVTTMQDNDGAALGGSGTDIVNSFEVFSNFTYPGLFLISVEELRNNRIANISIELPQAPAQSKVKSTVYVFFTTQKTITAADYKYDDAQGLWAPNDWGSVSIGAVGRNLAQSGTFNVSKAFRGYRTSQSTINGSVLSDFGAQSVFRFGGAFKFQDTLGIDYSAVINKGPTNPVGKKWVLDVKITSAFDDINGTTYYKKTIIVTDEIPQQASNVGSGYV